MNESLLVMVPFLVLVILSMLPIVGCVGEDPDAAYDRGQADEKKNQEVEKAKETAADTAKKEAEKYDKTVSAEPDLVSYWRLSEGPSGSDDALDSAPDMPKPGKYKNSAGGGVNRDVPGALSLLPDPADKAAEFDGVQGHVEVPHDPLINPVLEFSVEAWIRPAVPLPPQPQVVLGSYETDAAGNVVRGFVLDVIPGAAGAPRVRGRIGNGTDFTTLDASLEGGTEHDGWRHVVLTYSVADKSAKLYVNADNGSPDAEMPPPPPAPPKPVFYVANASSPWRIAAGLVEQPAPSPSAGQFFKGRIDEVALYRVPLDGPTVKKHFLHGIALPS
jgi:hypothetical protein